MRRFLAILCGLALGIGVTLIFITGFETKEDRGLKLLGMALVMLGIYGIVTLMPWLIE
jgi:hypothetical protein